ncbi:MAG: protein kinase, partial [Chloroflexales bacterium]|nr:protein kinase [Chloroflexales bacterium]
MTEPIGRQFGDYQIEALLASGPTGQVFSGRHIRLGRPAAVKLFDAALLARPGVRSRLLATLRDVAALRHPRLAEIYDVGDQDERLFLASELLAGGSLRSLLLPGTPASVPLTLCLQLAAQAAEGLAVAHGGGFVHGAVKPESLWLERAPGALPTGLKICDLGVAAVLSEEAFGSPAYLSPEQCRGQAIDGRSDLYSLGVVLYELLLGAPPFNVRTVEAAVEKHLRTRPVPPRLVRPEIPAEVEALVLRCLAKSPEQRFPDASAFASAARELIATLVPAPPALPINEQPTVSVTAPVAPAPPLAEQPTVSVSAPITQNPAPRVQILGPQGVVLRVADLAAGTLTLGRAPERDLYIDDPQISREHLRLDWDGQRITATDLGSANGSFVGGVRLAPGVVTPWDGRAPLRVGPFTLRLEPAAATAFDDTLLTGLLSGATAPAAAAPPGAPHPRIEMRADQEHVAITPGAPTVIALRLSNTGHAADEVTLSVEGVPGAWLQGPGQQALRLDPGGQASTSILVTVPRGPEAPAGDYAVVVRARSLAGAEVGTARLRWTVLPYSAADLRIAPPRAESRDTAGFQVIVRNLGNQLASYYLSFEDDDDTLGYALEQDEVSLEPGQSARVSLTVEAAGRLFGVPQARPFTIRADAGREEVAVAEGEFIHLATLPAWVAMAALGALALVVLLGALALFGNRDGGGVAVVPTATAVALPPTLTPLPTPLPGAPAILEFRATPDLVSPGQPVVISWNVQGAERVIIDRFGDVPPQGQREYRPEQTTELRLTAVAPGGKESFAILYANV